MITSPASVQRENNNDKSFGGFQSQSVRAMLEIILHFLNKLSHSAHSGHFQPAISFVLQAWHKSTYLFKILLLFLAPQEALCACRHIFTHYQCPESALWYRCNAMQYLTYPTCLTSCKVDTDVRKVCRGWFNSKYLQTRSKYLYSYIAYLIANHHGTLILNH